MAMNFNESSAVPSICRRCSALLTPGKGDFYVVEVQAYAENSPLVITAEDLARDHQEEMRRLVEKMEEVSGQEMMDQVQRHMTFYLCASCYRLWIENPTG